MKRQRLGDAVVSRLLGQAPALNQYSVETVRTPMRDGVRLLGDHFAPHTDRPGGTVLIRTPYGRNLLTSALNGRMFAARGYHVLLQSVRGTFGSEGTFTPMAQEAEDGRDTVAWLREQPWFDGRLATLGASYLGWTQWTLLQDPPPELRAAVVYVAPHDFREATYGTGAFTLGDFLGWSDQIVHQEDGGLRRVLSMATAQRRLRPALAGLPLAESARPVLGDRAPWFAEWVGHPDGDDPWWEPYRAGDALTNLDAPTLLIGGWQDLFLDQTLQQYETLHERGVDVALTVGPWTHLQVGLHAAGLVARESLAWLDQHLAGGAAARKSPVRVHRTGEKAWHELPAWPPPSEPATLHLRAGRRLTTTAPDGPEGVAEFRYDPADPTPSLGGRTLTGSMGVKDNRPLEARADVLVFSTDPLPTAVDVIGSPVLDLTLSVDNPFADVFVRLCDVDPDGRSHNFADQHRRLDPAIPAGRPQRLELTLDQCFHRLLAGHRLRLQISGGAFPRFARNPGTDGAGLAASRHTVDVAASRLTLPVATAPPATIG
ncbi:putative CocE/NonD family hydrolase [Actinoplanes octamycinicus]|uniref:Putative CocE/NonD family hydrolase n=1 Tax=Actinoplanes octamycinicus TaxID=135948 RepID=A0A7W7GS09_9ACTN|nr:CocE/NonD family hydrolase [Actinoplanes octamycinicus]MBB4737218.1 putative CocE/NonD family hydrolase [Actinoplanes octamycinicus]GIE61962.1 hydrolase [Actinoplanes octamycinicus]